MNGLYDPTPNTKSLTGRVAVKRCGPYCYLVTIKTSPFDPLDQRISPKLIDQRRAYASRGCYPRGRGHGYPAGY
ncbi:MAG: hypothetical protein COZ04_00960 [Candidatus Aenigmarchaeota archaeon CG_4_10_14_3_um_filter_37_21]|nr:MAG: hypothetical protein AUJ50_01045 [Candidatus Aenigmarchaeota archaeon CG1_02_38_14]PIY36298.1 MAG: hypothetical protein COZ04_00960 [Candidatus Aenigmarchaeota archaeon CG_4_10_14_3_um_filter_37_21]